MNNKYIDPIEEAYSMSMEGSDEIERRWLIKPTKEFANKVSKLCTKMNNSYIYNPDLDSTRCRFRQIGNKYFLTVKAGYGYSKLEIEQSITKEEYDRLTENIFIEEGWFFKDKYGYEYKPSDKEGVYLVEREFKNKQEGLEFEPNFEELGIGTVICEVTTAEQLTKTIIEIYEEKKAKAIKEGKYKPKKG